MESTIWAAWMRLPVTDALRETRRVLSDMLRQRELLAACRDTLEGLPKVMEERRVVPTHVREMWLATHTRR